MHELIAPVVKRYLEEKQKLDADVVASSPDRLRQAQLIGPWFKQIEQLVAGGERAGGKISIRSFALSRPAMVTVDVSDIHAVDHMRLKIEAAGLDRLRCYDDLTNFEQFVRVEDNTLPETQLAVVIADYLERALNEFLRRDRSGEGRF